MPALPVSQPALRDADVLRAPALRAPERLAAVRASGLLDAESSDAFDRATRLVQKMLGVPVAHFSVVDAKRQVYPSQIGLPEPLATAREMPLEGSLCKHVVAEGRPFSVGDARAEPRLSGNPSVDAFGVQAYLGVPVQSPDGHVLGAICGLDVTPRAWTAADEEALADIAAGVEAELVLRAELRARKRSETQYRELFEGASDAVLVLDPTTEVILDANAQAAVLYGYDRADLVGTSLQALSTDAAAGEGVTARLMAGGAPEHFESVQRRRDGALVTVRISASAVRVDGRPVLMSINRDVTAQRASEAALATSRLRADRLALVAQKTTNGVVVTDAHGITEWVNEGFTRISGYTLADLAGKKPGHVLQGPGTDPATVQRLHGLMKCREPFAFEILNYHKNGTPYWIQVEVTPLVEDDGTLSGFMAIETDVTERRQAEAALRASEAQYRSVVANVRDAVCQTDLDGLWTFLSPAWEQITGYTVAESLGQHAGALVHPDALGGHQAAIERLGGGAPFVRFESQFVTRAGAARHVEIHTHLLRDASGAVVGSAGTVSDITDSVRFAAEREARRKTEEMLRLKSAFLNNMSHELRTPLTGILGFAEVLAEEVPADLRGDVEVILRGGRRLQDTLNSVLDLAQIESGTVALHPEPLDVLAEARDAAAVLATLSRSKGLTLEVTGETGLVTADRSALHRVLYNLVGNALKFTAEGGVRVCAEPRGDRVRLSVADTGIGIDAAFLPRLFDEFTQASEGYARTHEGNGLGLSITQRLVDLMGGTLSVESAVGAGTTFTVDLPAAEALARLEQVRAVPTA